MVGADQSPVDPFEVVDRLAKDHSLLYLVDLDGIERGEPQLDYIQEFSRDVSLWVDAGVRTADQSIDILVAGAQRAVVSSSMLEGPRELARAWGLSTELVYEMDFEGGALRALSEWTEQDAPALGRTVRTIGPTHLVANFPSSTPDWAIVRTLAQGGPTWVAGSVRPPDAARIQESGASGGIYDVELFEGEVLPPPKETLLRSSPSSRRDDEE